MAETTGKSIREWMPSIVVIIGVAVGFGYAQAQIESIKSLRAEDMRRIDDNFAKVNAQLSKRTDLVDVLLSDIRDRLARLETRVK